MKIGVPREIKVQEYRVGLTPESVAQLAADGHQICVEHDAGLGIGATDDHYRSAGATIARDAREVFEYATLIVKVKEPLAPERARLRSSHTLFTYLHLAPDPYQAQDLIQSGATAIAYETVSDDSGGLPLLAPMSIIAGRMAAQVAARFLERPQGGRGVLLSGAPGVPGARVLVLGAGNVGASAARIAHGMGASVRVLNKTDRGLEALARSLGPRLTTGIATPEAIADAIRDADTVIGAALVTGDTAPKLITRAMLKQMKPGAVLVDVSIDQGGCFETSRPTTHADPVFTVDGIVHYCVANMPGAVPFTSTHALNAATLPFVRKLANLGTREALRTDPHLRNGLNVCGGSITRPEIAAALGHAFHAPLDALARNA